MCAYVLEKRDRDREIRETETEKLRKIMQIKERDRETRKLRKIMYIRACVCFCGRETGSEEKRAHAEQ